MTATEAIPLERKIAELVRAHLAATSPNEPLAFCPSCGLDLSPPISLVSGGFRADSNDRLFFDGGQLPLSPQRVSAMTTLMRARGQAVSVATLADRMGCDAEDYDGVVRVTICQARRVLRERGVSLPVETVRGRGYRWTHPVTREV